MDHGERPPAGDGSLRDFVADFAYNSILRSEMTPEQDKIRREMQEHIDYGKAVQALWEAAGNTGRPAPHELVTFLMKRLVLERGQRVYVPDCTV